jgi:hypothetical protein
MEKWRDRAKEGGKKEGEIGRDKHGESERENDREIYILPYIHTYRERERVRERGREVERGRERSREVERGRER